MPGRFEGRWFTPVTAAAGPCPAGRELRLPDDLAAIGQQYSPTDISKFSLRYRIAPHFKVVWLGDLREVLGPGTRLVLEVAFAREDVVGVDQPGHSDSMSRFTDYEAVCVRRLRVRACHDLAVVGDVGRLVVGGDWRRSGMLSDGGRPSDLRDAVLDLGDIRHYLQLCGAFPQVFDVPRVLEHLAGRGDADRLAHWLARIPSTYLSIATLLPETVGQQLPWHGLRPGFVEPMPVAVVRAILDAIWALPASADDRGTIDAYDRMIDAMNLTRGAASRPAQTLAREIQNVVFGRGPPRPESRLPSGARALGLGRRLLEALAALGDWTRLPDFAARFVDGQVVAAFLGRHWATLDADVATRTLDACFDTALPDAVWRGIVAAGDTAFATRALARYPPDPAQHLRIVAGALLARAEPMLRVLDAGGARRLALSRLRRQESAAALPAPGRDRVEYARAVARGDLARMRQLEAQGVLAREGNDWHEAALDIARLLNHTAVEMHLLRALLRHRRAAEDGVH
jgi:hypothetical protein